MVKQQDNAFKTAICNYLRGMAHKDKSLIEKFKREGKNIDECINYIIGEVKESGRSGFADEEIFSLAMHYYDEDNENLKKHSFIPNVKIVVNTEIPFTEEERKKAREEAYKAIIAEEKAKMTAPKTNSKLKEINIFEEKQMLLQF